METQREGSEGQTGRKRGGREREREREEVRETPLSMWTRWTAPLSDLRLFTTLPGLILPQVYS